MTRLLSTDKQIPTAASAGCSTLRSSRPSASAWRAGAATSRYDPLKPPADPNNPKWENIDALVGNQYSRISNLLASGMSTQVLEWQLVARARPGVVDTSALPMDFVSNPGTMNAIINFARRPQFEHECSNGARLPHAPRGQAGCMLVRAGPVGKCWERSLKKEQVHHILKGGEDFIGALEAIQRVYFNIGSCAEQCWVNHVPDLRAADPHQRNYGQTPFDIGQCRRDCGSFRAIEDRLEDIKAFFLTARPTDLWKARGLASPRDLEIALDAEFFEGAVAQGRGGLRRHLRQLSFEPEGPLRECRLPCRPTRATPRCGSTGSATTSSGSPPRSAPIRDVPCTPTT